MTNELENQVSFEMSPEEIRETKSAMMRYRANSLSYWLGFGGIGFSILGSFICLNSFQPGSVLVIFKILMNVVILLFGFLSCEKAKAYSKQGSISLIAIGGVCALRILWVPLQLLLHYNKYVTANAWLTEENAKAAANKDYVIDATLKAQNQNIVDTATKYLGKTITDGAGSINWLPTNGNLRAYLAIGFLVCAALMFIGAGIVGCIRSKKLATYMSTINKKD